MILFVDDERRVMDSFLMEWSFLVTVSTLKVMLIWRGPFSSRIL